MKILLAALMMVCVGCVQPKMVVAPAPPSVPATPYSVEWSEAITRTLAVRPTADKDLIDLAPSIVKVVVVPEGARVTNPTTGNIGFYLQDLGISIPPEVLNVVKVYPNSVGPDGRLLVRGYTDVDVPGTITVYVVDESVLPHEFLHALWFLLYPTERCPDGFPVWNVVDHHISCDPLN